MAERDHILPPIGALTASDASHRPVGPSPGRAEPGEQGEEGFCPPNQMKAARVVLACFMSPMAPHFPGSTQSWRRLIFF